MIGTVRRIGAATSAKIWQTDRGAWTVLVAVLFLTVGFLFRWEQVPSTERSYLYADRLELKFSESVLALPLRMAVMIVACLLLFEVLMGERQRFLGRAGAWIILALTLAFPYAVNLWEPEVAYDGATVWNSLDEMIWTEMDRAYQFMQTQWRIDEPLSHPGSTELALLERPLAGLFPTPSGAGRGFGPEGTNGRVGSALLGGLDFTFFRSARTPEVFSSILGYSNAFLNLASKGWYFSLMGSLIAIIGLYLPGSPNTSDDSPARPQRGRRLLRFVRCSLDCAALHRRTLSDQLGNRACAWRQGDGRRELAGGREVETNSKLRH